MSVSERAGNIMEEMTVQDMIAALEQTSTAILVSGGTEQHGYHLPLSTDYLPGYEVSKCVSRKTGGPLQVGCVGSRPGCDGRIREGAL